ncbi:hypothetical protein [Nannocystis radixulma]|uniref:Myxococcus cysteine-rich repeat-containing protein n=1 Tax=Nannocystis radixulma TaxID=2995305 RepID=A0ABT5BD10_9BACT|nr:hypothetical protein [Nannocystis radixulma]MDC0672016.1 hypothetical protein [Nannocystis radixulma]
MPAPVPARHLPHAALLALLVISFPGCSNDSPGTTDCGTASCSATDTTTTDASTSTPTTGPTLCGNAVVDPGELCDDGEDCDDGVCNLDAYTGKEHCSASCSGLYPNWCGDKAMQSQEACDEGGNTPTCDADCTPVECGDGLLNAPAGEACDDGPANSDAYDDTLTSSPATPRAPATPRTAATASARTLSRTPPAPTAPAATASRAPPRPAMTA